MPTTPRDMIPTPATVDVLDGSVVLLSQFGRMPRQHRPDPTLHPRRFRLSWSRANGALGDWARRHYADFPHEVFSFKVPRTGEVVFAKWLGHPNIQWSSATAVAGISAEVEEVLAHE